MLNHLNTLYSYANVSRTVSRDALRAGNALAMVARKSVRISQAIIPVTPYTVGIGAVRIAIPTPKQRTPVIWMAIRMVIAQLIKPTTKPSTITIP